MDCGPVGSSGFAVIVSIVLGFTAAYLWSWGSSDDDAAFNQAFIVPYYCLIAMCTAGLATYLFMRKTTRLRAALVVVAIAAFMTFAWRMGDHSYG